MWDGKMSIYYNFVEFSMQELRWGMPFAHSLPAKHTCKMQHVKTSFIVPAGSLALDRARQLLY